MSSINNNAKVKYSVENGKVLLTTETESGEFISKMTLTPFQAQSMALNILYIVSEMNIVP